MNKMKLILSILLSIFSPLNALGYVKCPNGDQWRCPDKLYRICMEMRNGSLKLECFQTFVPAGWFLKAGHLNACPTDQYSLDPDYTNASQTSCQFFKDPCNALGTYTVYNGTTTSNINCSCRYWDGYYNPFKLAVFSMNHNLAGCYFKNCTDGFELKMGSFGQCLPCKEDHYKVGSDNKSCIPQPICAEGIKVNGNRSSRRICQGIDNMDRSTLLPTTKSPLDDLKIKTIIAASICTCIGLLITSIGVAVAVYQCCFKKEENAGTTQKKEPTAGTSSGTSENPLLEQNGAESTNREVSEETTTTNNHRCEKLAQWFRSCRRKWAKTEKKGASKKRRRRSQDTAGNDTSERTLMETAV